MPAVFGKQVWLRFLIYGALGWIVEVIFTGVGSFIAGDWELTSYTYLWMFPIYGLAALGMEWLHSNMQRQYWFVRGIVYVVFIFTVEYLSGWLLCQWLGACPWEYPASSPHIGGFIRLDFAPAWLALSFVFERMHFWLLAYL